MSAQMLMSNYDECRSAGFLSTEDSSAPGNNALLDLVAALHWVKENIAAFGGDPDQVTLMGQGHGAALVNILMISPIAKGQTRALPLSPVCSVLGSLLGGFCGGGGSDYH